MADKKEVINLSISRCSLTVINVIYSTLSMNYIQLDWLNFIFPLRNLACYSYIQKFRIKSLLERQTKKAAEELNKARMQQLNARVKEGEISLHYFFHSSPLISFNFALSSAKQALPPPPLFLQPAAFEVGQEVQTLPDTTPGVHPNQSIAVYGTVIECEFDGVWKYHVKA